MDTNNIPKTPLIDIIFNDRNKAYGAYELRTNYSSRLGKSLAFVFSVTAFLFVYSLMAKDSKNNDLGNKIDTVVTLADAPKKEEVIKIPEVIEPVKEQATSTVATERFDIPKIVPDDLFVETDRPPEIADLEHKKIAKFTSEGNDDIGQMVPPSILKEESIGPSINDFKKPEDEEPPIAITVSIEAQYPGGQSEWRRFLERNLDYPEGAEESGIQGDVWVQFIVDKEGNISEITALNDLGGGLAEEAIRIIKRSKKWKPAEYNGKKVTYRQKQKITFRIH
ncbi:energy transducer TonB [Polluticaenibacter yanchengensis]|uniref:Energy transducer TonB n=1 Tax=Polluticaenibacter yanchengensis TaxID=3014562 RepID=A0ABT4UK28_9BACT|nr:energy transducer TonB [Chitinophagaceae bacterium LY-5]